MSRDKESLERHEDSLKKIGPQICCIPNGRWGLAKCKSAAKNMLVLTQIWASLFLDQLLQNRTLIALSNKKLEACSPFRSSATTQQTQSIVHNQQLTLDHPASTTRSKCKTVTSLPKYGVLRTPKYGQILISRSTFDFTGVSHLVCGLRSANVIHRLFGRWEIRNFSSSLEEYSMCERSERVKYFWTREEKFRISQRPCKDVLFMY